MTDIRILDAGEYMQNDETRNTTLIDEEDPHELFNRLGVEYDKLDVDEDSDDPNEIYTTDSISDSGTPRTDYDIFTAIDDSSATDDRPTMIDQPTADDRLVDSTNVSDLTQAAAQAMLELLNSKNSSIGESHGERSRDNQDQEETQENIAGAPRLYEEVKSEILEALELNRKYQQELTKRLDEIYAHKRKNIELQKKLHELHMQQTRTTRRPISVPANPNATIVNGKKIYAPFFVDTNGNIPPDNEDTIRRHQFLTYKARRWTDKERENLAKGVRAENMRNMAEKLKASGEANIWDVQKLSHRELEMNLEGLNWDKIAKLYVQTRKPNECLIQWTNQDHPLINKSNWTYTESKHLQRIAEEHRFCNWVSIAKALGTQRTAAQCFRYYQAHLNKAIQKRAWTDDEDKILTEMVHVFGERNWQQIAHAMGTRTGQQCLHRWSKTLNPAIRRGRWDRDEDEGLREAVRVYGVGNWVKIQQHVIGRTDVQCRERWMNVLSPTIVREVWRKEEDNKLLELVMEHGTGKWSRVAQDMKGRTDNQCWRRWKALKRKKHKKRPSNESGSDTEDSQDSQSSTARRRTPKKRQRHQPDLNQTEKEDSQQDDSADEGDDEDANELEGDEKSKDIERKKKRKVNAATRKPRKKKPRTNVTAADLDGLARNFKIPDSSKISISSTISPSSFASIAASAVANANAANAAAQAATAVASAITSTPVTGQPIPTSITLNPMTNTDANLNPSMIMDPNILSIQRHLAKEHIRPLPPNSANAEALLNLVRSDIFNTPGLLFETEQQSVEFLLMQARFEAMFAWPFLLGTIDTHSEENQNEIGPDLNR